MRAGMRAGMNRMSDHQPCTPQQPRSTTPNPIHPESFSPYTLPLPQRTLLCLYYVPPRPCIPRGHFSPRHAPRPTANTLPTLHTPHQSHASLIPDPSLTCIGQTSPQTTEMNNGRLARGSPVRGSPLRGSPLRGIPTLPTDSSRPARLMGSAARLPAPLEVDEPWRPDILNSNETGELGFRRSKQLTQVRLRRCASAGGQLV
mmetsp:Transcript_30684/g.69200  ORF Transcript_30684/g.69200 Transcript_30684/m.69200 type:complete len:202 (-) Transcript_30684:435-1040(-)